MEFSIKKSCLGIDVSKDSLDIFWNNKFYTIENTADSISAFIKAEIDDENVFCVLESTGGYERKAVAAFHAANLPIHVAHPNKVHAFAKACGHFAKTDKLDALLLHKYAEFICENEGGDREIDPLHQEIIALQRVVRAIEEDLHRAQCRRKQMLGICGIYLGEQIRFYKDQLETIHREIDAKIEAHPDLWEKRALLLTMKGVGPKTASVLLAELPELGTLCRKKIASLLAMTTVLFSIIYIMRSLWRG